MLLRSAKREASGPSIEMTPMIDMVFLLLIFFLVATTFQEEEREMQIALPEASAAGPISTALREIIINVAENGDMIVSGRAVETDELRSMIEEAVADNPDQKITVRGDQRATYGAIVRPLDICKAAGIQEPYLDTVVVGGD
ncbi:MAG TPA: biopolymer transporter ExbD [Phycisphaerae bacterium]|nr:biopolymer transporter ExbD [Phycisphaerae bacterium]HRW52099.1 biopolymer transporter ExbD [Phycisphaerae bacterium]